MTSRYTSLFRFSFASADLIVLNLVHLVLMNSLRRLPANSGPEYLLLFIVANILWLISAYASGLYIEQGNPNYMRFIKRTVKCLISFFLLMALFIFFNHYPYSRIFVVISFLGFAVLLVAMRLLMMEASVYAGKNGKAGKRVVIIGYNELAVKLAKRFSEDGSISSVEGYFEDKERVGELSLLPIIGNIDECLQYAVNNNINEIYSTISPERNYSIYEMAYRAEKALIRFKFVPDFKLYVNRNTHMEYIDQFPVLSLRPEPLEDVTNSIKKRIFDMAFSAMVIVFVLSWLVPVLAILIKLNSRGPVFFVQWRSGKGNKKFKCYKFRSLSVNADANVKQVTLNDSRVTPLGRFLRKTNLDELPQFFNVFKGDMSVIGPRPHMLLHTDIFSRITEQYMIRHFVKPGVTGWAQINGYRGEIKEESQLRKRIEHDIWYLENWSLWLDVRIMLQTIYLCVKGDRNAY